MVPLADRMWKVSLRTVTMPIASQQIITEDNVSIGVAAVAYYRRVDPVKSIIEIENVESAVGQIAQTTVRNVVGRSSLDQVLSNTEALNVAIKKVLDLTTEQWGSSCARRGLKDIELPASMQRAMAKQAEAEREKRAKIIAAEGDSPSVGRLAEAADVIANSLIALQLRKPAGAGRDRRREEPTIVFPAQFFESTRTAREFLARRAPAPSRRRRRRPGGSRRQRSLALPQVPPQSAVPRRTQTRYAGWSPIA